MRNIIFIGMLGVFLVGAAKRECRHDVCPNPGGLEGQRRCAEQLCIELQLPMGCYDVEKDLWRACKGNLDYYCVFRVCERVQGGFDSCDKKENAVTAARLCDTVFGECVERHCPYGAECDSFSDVAAVIDQYCKLD